MSSTNDVIVMNTHVANSSDVAPVKVRSGDAHVWAWLIFARETAVPSCGIWSRNPGRERQFDFTRMLLSLQLVFCCAFVDWLVTCEMNKTQGVLVKFSLINTLNCGMIVTCASCPPALLCRFPSPQHGLNLGRGYDRYSSVHETPGAAPTVPLRG